MLNLFGYNWLDYKNKALLIDTFLNWNSTLREEAEGVVTGSGIKANTNFLTVHYDSFHSVNFARIKLAHSDVKGVCFRASPCMWTTEASDSLTCLCLVTARPKSRSIIYPKKRRKLIKSCVRGQEKPWRPYGFRFIKNNYFMKNSGSSIWRQEMFVYALLRFSLAVPSGRTQKNTCGHCCVWRWHSKAFKAVCVGVGVGVCTYPYYNKSMLLC